MKKFLGIFLLLFVFLFPACQEGEEEKNLLLKIEGAGAKQYVYNVDERILSTYLSPSQLEDEGLTGEYEGGAIAFNVYRSGYQSSGYTVKVQKDLDEYEAIKKEGSYQKLFIWVCVTYTGEGSVTLTNYNAEALNENTVSVPKSKQGKWFQLTSSLNAKIKTKLFDEQGNPKEVILFRTHFDETDVTARLNVYVGDIGLC